MNPSVEDEKDLKQIHEDSKYKNNNKENKDKSIVKDRLSNLPDEVIHRVLSFLDATTVVQTSVLSKRWRYLWTSLPVLNFDDSHFDDPLLFQYFVEHVLSLRDASSNVYVLKFAANDELYDGYIVDSIIDYVIPKGIQVLSILGDCVVGKLPQLSACQTLTTLELVNIATETTTFEFVSLQNLYLFDCKFECGVGEVLDLFRGCVNLRCMVLHGCQYYGEVEKFKIYAPQLTDLSISCLRLDEVFNPGCVIELFTPKLQSFSYEDDLDLYGFHLEANLPFVEKVEIDVGCSDALTGTKATDLFLKLIELFEVMGSAKFVSLSPSIIEVLSMFPTLLDGRSSPFTRMQTFELNTDEHSPYAVPTNVMAYLFGGSPGFDFY